MALSVVHLATPRLFRLYSDEQVELAGGGAYYLLKRGEKPIIEVESSGLSTIESMTIDYDTLEIADHRVRVTATRLRGAVKGLPKPVKQTIYVVPQAVALAVPERKDVFFPGPAIMDAECGFIGLRHA